MIGTGKAHLYLWCQRQGALVVRKAHPGHQYLYPLTCNDSMEEFFGFTVKTGECFVMHLGEGGNYKLSREDVIKVVAEQGISPQAAKPWIRGDRLDVLGKSIT